MAIFRKQKSTSRKRPTNARSAQTYSYFQSREDETLPQRRKTGWSSRLKHIPTYVAALVIVGAVLYASTLTTNPKIVVVNEDDQHVQLLLRDKSEYQDLVRKQLQSSIFNRSKLSVNSDAVSEALLETFPEAADLTLVVPFIGRNPIVYLQVAQPELELRTSSGDSFVIDQQGRAVVEASQVPDSTKKNLTVVEDKSGLVITTGSFVLTDAEMEFINQVTYLLGEKNLKVSKLVLPLEASQIDVHIKGQPYKVKLTTNREVREQVGAYLATKQQLAKDNVTPSSYVDVRVDGRTFVK